MFELTIIFFELINSPVIFIVGMEEEKEHDKIVEKVVKRLAENDLYVKPEKYK